VAERWKPLQAKTMPFAGNDDYVAEDQTLVVVAEPIGDWIPVAVLGLSVPAGAVGDDSLAVADSEDTLAAVAAQLTDVVGVLFVEEQFPVAAVGLNTFVVPSAVEVDE